jgi:hypothetical protein
VNTLTASLLAGLLFGAGLAVSQMTNPAKVQNFLDVFGAWDPSLALVMGAALAVTSVGFRAATVRAAPLCEPEFCAPTRRDIDAPLLLGAALFGIGWGLAGFCPGPALAALSLNVLTVRLFVVAMLLGITAHRWIYTPLIDARADARTKSAAGSQEHRS